MAFLSRLCIISPVIIYSLLSILLYTYLTYESSNGVFFHFVCF